MKLVNLCNKYDNIIILSDETYQYLGCTYQKSLATYHKNIISMNTFSKIFAPAVRLGFIYTKNNDFIKLFNNSGFMESGGSVNAITGYQMSLINEDAFIENILYIADSLGEKSNIICKELAKYPKVFNFVKPRGGYFVWVKSLLCDSNELLKIATNHKINFHIGTKFSPKGNNQDYFRLSCSYYSDGDLIEYFGERLAKIVGDVELFNTKTVYLHGHTGRLGGLIAKELNETTDYDIMPLGRNYDNLDGYKKNAIVVDVSLPDGLYTLLQNLIEKKLTYPLIVGTTGYDVKKFSQLADTYESNGGKILVCPNFSIGVNTCVNMLSSMNTEKNYWTTLKLVDEHHSKKLDQVSGTSKLLLSCIDDVTNGIIVESIREGDIVGTHTLTFDAPNETIIVKHISKSRNLFSSGCVRKIINYFNNGLLE